MIDIIKEIQEQAIRHPHRTAITGRQGSITYQALVQAIHTLEMSLREHYPANTAPIAVIGHKQPEMIAAFFGAAQAGHAYIPIDDSTPPARIEKILEIARPAAIWTVQDIKDIVNRSLIETSQFEGRSLNLDAPWYILFTSGSTGEPKGVVITAGNLVNFLEWLLAEQKFAQGEVFLNQAPFSFDLSVMDFYPCLMTGGTLLSVTRDEIAEPRLLFEGLSQSNLSTWVSTPSFAEICIAEPAFSDKMLPCLQRFLFCGEILPSDLAAQLMQRFPRAQVWNTYGPTEATVATTSVRITESVLAKYPILPIGYPKPGCSILIDPIEEAADQNKGEIIIRGGNVSPGYLGRPDLSQLAFFKQDGAWSYRTGDLGHFADGLLFFDGRKDSQIKLHGYRIELGDIEENLRHLSVVKEAAVLPILKSGKPDSLAAFVVLEVKATADDFTTTKFLKQALGQFLPSYMIPRRFIYMPAFPLNANGKVDRRRLAGMLA